MKACNKESIPQSAFAIMEVAILVHAVAIIAYTCALIGDVATFDCDGHRYFLSNTCGLLVFSAALVLTVLQYNKKKPGGEVWTPWLSRVLVVATLLPLWSYRGYAIIPWVASVVLLIFEAFLLYSTDSSKIALEDVMDGPCIYLSLFIFTAYLGSMIGGPVEVPLKVATAYTACGVSCWCKARFRKQLPSMLYLYGASAGSAFLMQIYGVFYYSGLDGTEMPQGIMSIVWIMTIICSFLNVFEVGIQWTRWSNCTPRQEAKQQEGAATAHMQLPTRGEMKEVRGGCYFEIAPCFEQTSGDEGAP